jgi:bifunctional UDP-N-acetylglucosamine pyrophosphorylase/glucosamine-1-phosphate N-acetyltransferase
MLDPANTYVDTTVSVGRDVTLFPGTILQGDTVVGDGSEIGPDTRLVDCSIGSGTIVESSTARQATVGDRCAIGPFAALTPGSKIPDETITGPFYTSRVET